MRTRTKLGIAALLALGLAGPGGLGVAAAGPEAEPQLRLATRGWLGVVLTRSGDEVRVTHVADDSPAAKAGIREDDAILAVNGAGVKEPGDVVAAVGALRAGDHVRLQIRRDGRGIDQDVVLDARPGHRVGDKLWRNLHELAPGMMGARVRLGLELQPLTEGLRGYFRVARDRGVLVADVTAGSPAEQAGVRPGDVLLSVNGQPVASWSQVMRALGGVEPGARVPLTIVRDGTEQSLEVTAEERPHGERGGLCLPGLERFELGDLAPEIGDRIREALDHASEALERHRHDLEQKGEQIERKLRSIQLRFQSV